MHMWARAGNTSRNSIICCQDSGIDGTVRGMNEYIYIYIYFTIFLDYREYFDNSRNLISILQQSMSRVAHELFKVVDQLFICYFFPYQRNYMQFVVQRYFPC